LPSLTLIAMFAYEPTCEEVGLPLKRPVEALNVPHPGLFAMLKVSGSPFASEAEGWKAYALPATTDVAGVPLITGGVLLAGARLTVMANAGRYAVFTPSLTRILMLEYAPTCDACGMPLRRPVEVLKLAQPGLFATPKRKVWPSGSEAVGRKEYCEPTYTDVAGVPEILGGRLAAQARPLDNKPATDTMNAHRQAPLAGADVFVVCMNDPHGLPCAGPGRRCERRSRETTRVQSARKAPQSAVTLREQRNERLRPGVRRFALESSSSSSSSFAREQHGEALTHEQSTVPPDSSLVGHRRHEACRCDGVLNSRGARS
jgi:hypothetical protein